jgi:hypothetical protein
MAAPQVGQSHEARRLSGIHGVVRALVPRVTRVERIAVGITAGFDAAPFFPLLGRVVMRFAQRLQVRRIEEQAQVAVMRAAMIDHGGGGVVSLSEAHHAARMLVQMRGAQSAPAWGVVEVGPLTWHDCRRSTKHKARNTGIHRVAGSMLQACALTWVAIGRLSVRGAKTAPTIAADHSSSVRCFTRST